MELKIPRYQALLTLAVCLLAVGIFVYFMGRFGGPELGLGGEPYTLSTIVDDTEGLSKKSDVSIRGVKVGEVLATRPVQGDSKDGSERKSKALVVFELYPEHADRARAGASTRIGEKSLLGEAYLDLDPGRAAAPALPRQAEIRSVQSTELDEALEPLARQGGAAMASLIQTFGRGAASGQTAERTSLTVDALRSLAIELRALTRTLGGQEANIAAGVQDTRTVLGEFGRREVQVTELVADGRATLEAIADQRPALERSLRELPTLLGVGRATLDEAKPLLDEARPLLADLRTASPRLTPALRDARPIARDTRRLLAQLPSFNRTAIPFLGDARPVVADARPTARALDPVLRNLVPMIEYLLPRKETLISWFSNTDAVRSDNPDSVGEWVRFLLFLEDKTSFGVECKRGSCNDTRFNPYAPRDDEQRLQPYEPGSYERLKPFRP